MSKIRLCRCGCGREAKLMCQKCESAGYFDESCQRSDWFVHRQVCFLEEGLDEPKSPALVGARFGKVRRGAATIPASYVFSLDTATQRILGDRRYVMLGTFCMPSDRFDRKFVQPGSAMPYRGVRADSGALYIRGTPGTQEFRASMANLSRLGADPGAQDLLRRRAGEFARDALDRPPESVAMEVESGLSIADQIVLLAAMSEYVLADGPGTIPGNADIVRAAHLTGRIQKLVEADARARGVTPVRSIAIDGILDAVWNNVDLGLYSPPANRTSREDIELSFRRIRSIPDDLVARCRRFTVRGNVKEAIAALTRMPNLTLVNIAIDDQAIAVATREDMSNVKKIIRNLQHLAVLDVDPSSNVDDWFADPELHIEKLRTWIPFSAESIPRSVRNLALTIRSSDWASLAKLTSSGSVPGVERLSILVMGTATVGAQDAERLAATFPNVTNLAVEISIAGSDQPDFCREVIRAMPNLTRLCISGPNSFVTGIAESLAARPNPRMTELRFTGIDTVKDLGSRLGVVAGILDAIPNARRIGVPSIAQLILRERYSTRSFDVVDASNHEGRPEMERHRANPHGAFAIPPTRVLCVLGTNLSDMGAIANRASPPRAIVCGMGGRAEGRLAGDLGYLRNAVAVTTLSTVDAVWISALLTAAPNLRYLSFELGSGATAERMPARELTTLVVHTNETMIGWAVEHIAAALEVSPDNLVVRTRLALADPNFCRGIVDALPRTRTICLPKLEFRAPRPGNTELYPTNVFTGDRPALAEAKYAELAWFEDPWNQGFNNI